jgi:uncharacterized integral membrane protein
LFTIHIYLARCIGVFLQVFWGIGAIAATVLALQSNEPLAPIHYNHPTAIFGVGFYLCRIDRHLFQGSLLLQRFETKFLTPLVPILLLGHLAGVLPLYWDKFYWDYGLYYLWCLLCVR